VYRTAGSANKTNEKVSTFKGGPVLKKGGTGGRQGSSEGTTTKRGEHIIPPSFGRKATGKRVSTLTDWRKKGPKGETVESRKRGTYLCLAQNLKSKRSRQKKNTAQSGAIDCKRLRRERGILKV